MSKVPDLREIPDLPEEIVQAGLNGELVLFVGSGTSMLLGLPSWGGLAAKVLESLQKKKILNYSELEQLRALEPKKQLSIATLIAKENKIDLELTDFFKGKSEGSSIDEINDVSKPLVLAVIEYVEHDYNSHDLLEMIARTSEAQPREAYEIWRKMLEGTNSDFPEEAVRSALKNIAQSGAEGVRHAKDIVSAYLKGGNERPSVWLTEIVDTGHG